MGSRRGCEIGTAELAPRKDRYLNDRVWGGIHWAWNKAPLLGRSFFRGDPVPLQHLLQLVPSNHSPLVSFVATVATATSVRITVEGPPDTDTPCFHHARFAEQDGRGPLETASSNWFLHWRLFFPSWGHGKYSCRSLSEEENASNYYC